MRKKLSRKFYNRTSLDLAQDLLGKYLVHTVNGIELVGKIVETEAYMGPIDKAAHSYNNRRTKRTEVMFGPPGYAYVYVIYGMYFCMNIVANKVDTPQAVLIRALEPVANIEKMAELRYQKSLLTCSNKEISNLTNGPGKLCKAFNITKLENGIDLCKGSFFLFQSHEKPEFEVVSTTRVGIDYAEEAVLYPWRFYIKGNRFVSRK